MVHPIYMAVLQRPELFAKHLANYVAQLRESTAKQGLASSRAALLAAMGYTTTDTNAGPRTLVQGPALQDRLIRIL